MNDRVVHLLEAVREHLEAEPVTEAMGPIASDIIRKAINTLDDRIKARAKKLGADQVSVSLLPSGIEVKAWIHGPESEAKDVAKILLGSKARLTAHKLKPNYFVGTVLYRLADLA